MAFETVPHATPPEGGSPPSTFAGIVTALFADVNSSAFNAQRLCGMLADAADGVSPSDKNAVALLLDRVFAVTEALNWHFDKISILAMKGESESRTVAAQEPNTSN